MYMKNRKLNLRNKYKILKNIHMKLKKIYNNNNDAELNNFHSNFKGKYINHFHQTKFSHKVLNNPLFHEVE